MTDPSTAKPQGEVKLLLNEDQSLTPAFEGILESLFRKYASKNDKFEHDFPPANVDIPTRQRLTAERYANEPLDKLCLKTEDLRRFATETNGQPLGEQAEIEIQTYLACTPEGWLKFTGFCQLYQLQTTSEPEETWKDLAKHGYDQHLKPMATGTA